MTTCPTCYGVARRELCPDCAGTGGADSPFARPLLPRTALNWAARNVASLEIDEPDGGPAVAEKLGAAREHLAGVTRQAVDAGLGIDSIQREIAQAQGRLRRRED